MKIVSNLSIIKPFSFLNEMLEILNNKQQLLLDEWYLFGGRNAGKSVSLHKFVFKCFLMKLNVTIYFLRDLKSTVFNTIWSDVYQYFKANDMLDLVSVNVTRHTIQSKFAKTRFIAKGLHQQKNDVVVFKAEQQIDTDYCFIIAEEANEMKRKDLDAVYMGLRGERLKQIVRFYMFNPTHSRQELVNYCEQNLPFNEELARDTGYYFKVIDNKVFHRTNYRANPYMIDNKALQAEFVKMWSVAPEQAKCWDLGAMGVIDNSIFASAMKFLLRQEISPYNFSPRVLFAGLDFGYKQDAFACLLMGLSYNDSRIYIIDEFYFVNKTEGLNHQTIGEAMMNWLLQNIVNFNYQGKIIVTCDSADPAWIEIINKVAKNMGVNNVYFIACTKTRVEVGIGIILEMLQKQALVLNNNKEFNLVRELFSLSFKETSATLTLNQTDNHAFDALRYGVYQHIDLLRLNSNERKSIYEWNK